MIRERVHFDSQTLVVVSTLIATLAFAANFTLPGGYNSDGPHKGMAVLAHKTSFVLFILSNTSAMVLSALAIFIQFVGKIVSFWVVDPDFKYGNLLVLTIFCNLLSILSMMLAFVTGTYTVLSHLPGLPVPVCILGCMFFFLAYLVIKKEINWVADNDSSISNKDRC
ncbi:hypothetical protein MKW98_018446 [Papaver atlanticum]|uniref:PGG domain-containing protein n=1 Tax=Papaver atlanticum TaxID=357466 RepID=A0AAD4XX81_9MAGN|nr:hypothetical protein MKW98_018446 [Papaver atlanticum]